MLICTSQRAFLLSSGIAVQNVTLWCVSFYHHVSCLTALLRKYTTLRLLLKSKRMTVISFVNRFFKTLTDNFHWLHLHPVTCTFPHPLKYFRIRIPLECGERYDPSIKSTLVSPQVTLNTIISPQIVTDMLDLTHEWVSRVTRWWNRFKLFFLLPSR